MSFPLFFPPALRWTGCSDREAAGEQVGMECTGGRAGDAPGMLWGRAGNAQGMQRRCAGDADPAAQRRAGAVPCSAGLPVTSNDLLCSCFRAGAAWPAGGLVAVSELPPSVT